jgi:hypothetical protein
LSNSSKKQAIKLTEEGELQKELKKLETVLPMEYASKNAVLELMDEAKDDFPYKIYFDNNMDGKHYSFYPKNPKDPNKAVQVTDTVEISSKIAAWFKKWFGNP